MTFSNQSLVCEKPVKNHHNSSESIASICESSDKENILADGDRQNSEEQDVSLTENVEDLIGHNNICYLSKVVNFVSGGDNQMLKVVVHLNCKPYVATIDTGAENSLSAKSVVDELELEIKLCNQIFRVAGDSNFVTCGTAITSLYISNLLMNNTKFCVFDDIACHSNFLVLGRDFLMSNSIEVCPSRRLLVKHLNDGGMVELYLDSGGKLMEVMFCSIPCFSAANLNVEQGKVCNLPIQKLNLPIDCDHMLLFTDDNKSGVHNDRLSGFSGISNVDTKFVLISAKESSVTIKENDNVGVFNSVLQLPDIDSHSTDVPDTNPLNHVSLPELDVNRQAEVLTMLEKYKPVFSASDKDVGLASVTSHVIRLTDDTPIFQRPRRFPQPIAEEIERQCQELNSLDIIEPSSSPWSSPVVPVRKKDGSIRMCIDYRKLNGVTVPDKFPMPNLADSIFGLKGTKYFTCLDLVRGYYQIPMDKDSKPYTAFSTVRNHWQFKRLSFGMRNAPSAFQRQIQAVLSTFPSNKVVAYIDDILIMGSSFEEHLSLVSKVLATLMKYNIKIKPSKCEWFRSEVQYLGHMVSTTGIKKTAEYVKKISNFPRPRTVGELREFLGFINFQRKFLPNCSEKQKPLSCLTGGRKNKGLTWNSAMNEAFETLKSDMQVDLELAYPDYAEDAEKLELWVDASAVGAGAYLAQKQGDSHRVIGFTSMTFSDTQASYSTLERELTALRWGVKTFRPFLYGVHFILHTDHQPLVHLHNMKLVCSRLARTVEELSDFNFEIRYVPGHLNSAADALSRLNYQVPETVTGSSPVIPKGLMLNGPPSPGGGDSLFVSLLRSLNSANCVRTVPSDEYKLRICLIDDLVDNASKYNLKLDRESRKVIRLMRCVGQLPSLDVLLAASRMFKVRVFVYFWSSEPTIYQFDDYDNAIHLQCISGIHFNSLIAVFNYIAPVIPESEINSVQSVRRSIVNEQRETDDESDSEPDLLLHRVQEQCCSHSVSSLPQVHVSIKDSRLCAIVDTGAEISLISQSGLKFVRNSMVGESNVSKGHVCDIVGFSGKKTAINETVDLKFSIGSFEMPHSHKFALVPDDIMPYCFLFGLEFLIAFNIDIDFSSSSCKRDGVTICSLVEKPCKELDEVASILTLVVAQPSKSLKSYVVGDIRFELKGSSDTVTGLSLLMNDETIRDVQSHCSAIKSVIRCINAKTPTKLWPKNVNNFARFHKRLEVYNGLLVYNFNCAKIIVVPFNILLEMAVTLHYDLAHIGRDKLMDLISDLGWHPSKYKVVNDICVTCHQCQIMKDFSTQFIPPTLKITTDYPFQLVAADLVSFPRTSLGNIGCLIVTDHYSKWVAAVPIKNKKTSSIIDALSDRIFPFLPSLPTTMLTDNGPEFSSSDLTEFLLSCGVSHKFTTPYCPSSNGAVERVNRTVKNFLKTMINDPHCWDDKIYKSVVVYNNTMHSELSMSPSRFLLSKAHRTGTDPPLQGTMRQTWRLGHPKFQSFKVNQFVLLKAQNKGFLNVNKFAPNFSGPCRITKVNENGLTYLITEINSGVEIRAHHSQLRIYREAPSYLKNNLYFQSVQDLESRDVVLPQMSDCDSESSSDNQNDYVSNIANTSHFNTSTSSSNSFSGFEVLDSESDSSFSGFRSLSDVSSLRSGTGSHMANRSITPRSSLLADCRLCRGCSFETKIENSLTNDVAKNVQDSVQSEEGDSVMRERNPELEIGLPSPLPYLYRLALYDINDDVDWELSSIDSTLMFDDEKESIDEELELSRQILKSFSNSEELNSTKSESNLKDIPIVHEPVQFDLNDSANENEFEGFGDNLVDEGEIINTGRRHTRSQGPVSNLPNVQTVTLERAIKKHIL